MAPVNDVVKKHEGMASVEVAAAEPPISICAFRRSTAGIERELLVIHAFPVSEP